MRSDEPILEQCENISENAPWFFISHNYRDYRDTLELRRMIIAQKINAGAWLFESDIPQGGLITPLANKPSKSLRFSFPM